MRRNEAAGRIKEKHSQAHSGALSIPFLAGRPKRDSVICSDDLMNLKIALATCKSLEEFLQVT